MSSIPMPSRNLATRVALPVALVGAAAALLAFTGWNALVPVAEAHVLPVLMRSEARCAADNLPAIDGELKALQLQAMTEAGYHRTKNRKWRRRYETGDTNDH